MFDEACWECASRREIASMWQQSEQSRAAHADIEASPTAERASERTRREIAKRSDLDLTELVMRAELAQLDRQHESAIQQREELAAEAS